MRLGISLFDQMREDLGIGLALKVMAAALQLFAQLGEVLDDAVVDDGDTTVAAGVGMGVNDGGLPWVAQRVWPIPQVASLSMLESSLSRPATLPTRRMTSRCAAAPSPTSSATPEES